jgi:phosphatidylserine synthase
MLLYHLKEVCNGTLLLMFAVIVCAGYAYYVNFKRLDDDPKKRNFHPVAIFLAPFTFPLLIFGGISLFLLRVLTYGVFLILFTIALIAFRKPFLLAWLRNTATRIGNALLEANTLLIKIFLRPWADEPETI